MRQKAARMIVSPRHAAPVVAAEVGGAQDAGATALGAAMGSKKGSEMDVSNVLAAARDRGQNRARRGRGRFSEVYVWMWKGYEELAAEMAKPDAPSWDDVADRLKELVEKGLPLRDGK